MMEPAEPTIDLILSSRDSKGRCTVCERLDTDIQCESCDPTHYLCRDCIGVHRDDFNRVLG